MKLVNLEKIVHMDYLIRHKSTGTPADFAQKVGMTRSTFFEYLTYMREELRLVINYDKHKPSYYYGERDLSSVFSSSMPNSF